MDRRLIKAGFGFQNWDMFEAAFHTMNHSWINNSSLPGWDTHTDIFMGQSHSEPNQTSLQRNKQTNKKKSDYWTLIHSTKSWHLQRRCTMHKSGWSSNVHLLCKIISRMSRTFIVCCTGRLLLRTIGQKGRNLQISAFPAAELQVRLVFLFNCCSKFHISVVFRIK